MDKNLVTEDFRPYHILFYTFQRLYNVVIRFFSSDFIGIEKTQVKLSCVRFHSQVFVTLLKFVFSSSHKNLIFKLFLINYYINFVACKRCKQECNVLEIILVQGFCPLNIKSTQFPNVFHHIL